ncbi:MAG: asparaginyl-tRNA synthetase [Candidatus Electronema aureum]|uniref:Asparagine--tRNA ligase n=1 Tax=Candidatus Electronema aureum TaxID=2005002 RepID=A0A521G2S1_9BACT|nr:MAG: asparaginyl-tRNA synthetase [Candidatus Electronema aureum]
MLPRIKELLHTAPAEQTVEVQGWVRTCRDSGSLCFIEVTDGSCLAGLQVVAEPNLTNYESEVRRLSTGCAVRVCGRLTASPAKGQAVEVRAERLTVIGLADPEIYPLQKKRHSVEFLRSISHLRPRTNSFGAVARIRSELNFAIHRFFREQGFVQVHTPIITTSDCEGAGEMFTVTALTGKQLRQPEPFQQDFFGRRAGLTVSGQLQAEIFALSHGRVYTFGPTFRAENSNTARHLAEFWMLEPEMAFCDLAGDMAVAEALIKDLVAVVQANCADELELFERFVSKGLLQKLEAVQAQPFARMSYTEAVEALRTSGKQFEFPVQWGSDLQSEHERFLCEELAGRPLIVTDYPKQIKPFYMRLNDDDTTVAAMDILVPGIGELVGGSQREERLELLEGRMRAAGLDLEEYSWYLDLRRFGSVPHAGFGLGFERLVQFVTGISNIRDVIPFPRTPGSAPC